MYHGRNVAGEQLQNELFNKLNYGVMKRTYVNYAVYVVFDGTSYYGLYGCDIEDVISDDEGIEVVEGPYKEWPDERIEDLNNEI